MPKTSLNVKHTLYFCLALVVSGIFILILRQTLPQEDAVPVGDRLWQITLNVRFSADNEPRKLHLSLPVGSAYIKLVRQTITHPEITIVRPSKGVALSNELIALADTPGEKQFIGEFVIQESEKARWIVSSSLIRKLSAKSRELYLQDSRGLALTDQSVLDALSAIRAGLADMSSLEQEVYNFIYEKIVLDPKTAYTDVTNVFSQMRANALGKTYSFISLCRAANIPARLVTGIFLKEAIDAEIRYWAEVYDGNQWQPYDLENGFAGELPSHYLAITFNHDSLSYFEDPTPVESTVDVEILPALAGVLGKPDKKLVQLFDLSRLDVSTQQLLMVLLILPFGALVTQIFRQWIGAKMFGTFSAPLLALAMVYADWITVLIIIAIVGIFGMTGRATLAEGLARTPRLIVVFTLVALSMPFAVSLMDYLNLNPDTSAVLLPIVILVSLIDRIYATQDESGFIVTLHRTAWTCLVAFLCFLLFQLEWLGQLVLLRPELHLFTLALILLLALYKGPMMIERPAFKWLREPETQ